MLDRITILKEGNQLTSDIGAALSSLEGKWEVEHCDVNSLPFTKKLFVKLRDEFWTGIIHLPIARGLSKAVLYWIEKQLIKPRISRLLQHLREFQPPIVMATSFVGVALISYLKRRGLYLGKLVVFFPSHEVSHMWLNDSVDLYLCWFKDQAGQLRQWQVDSAKYVLVRPDLAKGFFAEGGKSEAQAELGLLTTMPTVVLVAGEHPIPVLAESFQRMIRSQGSFQVVVICGKNEEFRLRLEKITSPVRHPVRLYGSFGEMDRLLSATDVIVGPLTMMELSKAAAKRVPIIITDPLESVLGHNLKHFLMDQVVSYGRIPAEVVFLIESALNGRKITNIQAAYEMLAMPKESTVLSDALNAIKPQALPASNIKIQNYQNEEDP